MKKTQRKHFWIFLSCLILTIVFLVMFIMSIGDYHRSKTTYEDLIYREFTVEEVRKKGDSETGTSYYITVSETDKRIEINNLLTERSVREGLDALRTGDAIACYLIETPSEFDAVEIKGEETILSLEQYNAVHLKQGRIGMILMPIGALVFLVFAIWYLRIYFKF